MSFEDIFVIRRIAQHLTRIDCIQWSRCSKAHHELITECCYLRLTEQQAGVVEKILDLSLDRWDRLKFAHQNRWGFLFPSRWSFPTDYMISSGTSTGKTIIFLTAATEMIRQGHDVCVVVPGKLFAQCIAQYEKFKAELKLAALQTVTIVDVKLNWNAALQPNYPTWLSDYQARKATGQPSILLIEKELLGENTSNSTHFFQEELKSIDWHAVLFDEATSVPFVIQDMTRTFGVSFNASSSGAVSNYATDPELGYLPVLDVECFLVPEISKTCSPKDIPSHCSTAKTWIQRCARSKTLVVTNDCFGMIEDKIAKEVAFLVAKSKQKPFNLSNLELPELTHAFAQCKGKEDKGAMVSNFCQANEGLMLAPMQYLSRGFNIPVESLVILDFNGKDAGKAGNKDKAGLKQMLQVVL